MRSPLISGSLCLWILLSLNAKVPLAAEKEASGFRGLISFLKQAPSGKGLVLRLFQAWKLKQEEELVEKLKWGSVSRTDTVLTRHYDPETGAERRERQVTIFLKKGQTESELAMDLAHEFVHASARPAFDPYDPHLTLGKYIRAAIEGEGGEVEAVVTECQIGLELQSMDSSPISRCQSYIQDQDRRVGVSREKVVRAFYRVGDWRADLLQELGGEASFFPFLSNDLPVLFSSTGHAPYPVALRKEFDEMTQIACENTRKRMKTGNPGELFPFLGLKASPPQPSDQNSQEFIAIRCQNRGF